MKKGTRGWISVAKLRELLIEVPGDRMVTPVNDDRLAVYDSGTKVDLGKIDFLEEKSQIKDLVS